MRSDPARMARPPDERPCHTHVRPSATRLTGTGTDAGVKSRLAPADNRIGVAPHRNQRGSTMIVQRTMQGAQAHLKVTGAIDNAAAPEFSSTLADLTQRECEVATLDLSDVPRICSAAIGTLILFFRSQTRLGRSAEIEGMHQNLRELFHTIRLDDVLHLKDA